jgi:uncharacterized protein (DUF2132 family)
MLNEPAPEAEPKPKPGSDDPLHGVTLKMMLERLVDYLGWEEMSRRIGIRCFANDPSIGSSLKFLRKTPWARNKVEELYTRYDFSDAKETKDTSTS